MRPFLSFVQMPHHASLHEPGEKIEFAYFPNKGLVSLVVAMKEGKTVEVGVVGSEGLIGTPAAVGLNRSPHRAVVQIAGDGHRIRTDALRNMLPTMPELQFMASRHAVIQGMQAAQSAACNRLHDMEQRLARWLLMCQDNVNSELLPLTHEFLAQMLGSGRPTVTIAAGVLERAGLIENTRGSVKIVNRKRLEDAACECYAVIQNFNTGLGLM